MIQLLSGQQQGRIPYHLGVALKTCNCPGDPQYLKTARRLDNLMRAAAAYWALIQGFWGHHPRIITVFIVDIRDGAIMWRDGRQLLTEDENGQRSNATVS